MASPFPGMDPYLEGDLWTSFHAIFATKIVEHLIPKLIPRYVALPHKRYIVVTPGEEEDPGNRYPDIAVRQSGNGRKKEAEGRGASAPLLIATIMSEPVPHTWVEIREPKKRKLVTAIEILSPTNKKGKARDEYLEKRDQYLHSKAHLMEIDLVREGRRLPMKKNLPSTPYFVFLSRAGRRPMTEVWPIAWEEPLPKVPVPLLKGDADVELDLQETLKQVFASTALDLSIDYGQPPDVPWPEDVARWASNLLRAAKRRK
jgi:hypothetical protein